MADSTLHSILNNSARKNFIQPPHSTEEYSEYQAFSYGRVGTRPVSMVCFVKADGFHLVLPYIDLQSISSADPSEGFELEFTARRITVNGRNLSVAFKYLREHRLAEIAEATRTSSMVLLPSESIVTGLKIEQTLKPTTRFEGG